MAWPRTPLAPPVRASAQAEAFATFIEQEYAQARGGTVKVMESMWHLWEEILLAANEPRILVCCTGENPRGSFAEQDQWQRSDRQWTIAVLRGQNGFRNLQPGEDGLVPPNAVENMTTSIEAVRDVVRRIKGVSEEWPINYKGWRNVPAVVRPGNANVFVAGALLEFSTANDLPPVSE